MVYVVRYVIEVQIARKKGRFWKIPYGINNRAMLQASRLWKHKRNTFIFLSVKPHYENAGALLGNTEIRAI